jgi:hypothetical protein
MAALLDVHCDAGAYPGETTKRDIASWPQPNLRIP